MEEIFRQAQLFQHGPGGIVVILAGDGVEDAPPVQFLDGLPDTGLQLQPGRIFRFHQDAVPEGVVQIPHQALDLLGRLFVLHGMALDEVAPQNVQLCFQILFRIHLHQIACPGAFRRQVGEHGQVLAGPDPDGGLVNGGVIVVDLDHQMVFFRGVAVAVEQEGIGQIVPALQLPQPGPADVLRDPDALPADGLGQKAVVHGPQLASQQLVALLHGEVVLLSQHSRIQHGHQVAPLAEFHMGTLAAAGPLIGKGQQAVVKPLAPAITALLIMGAGGKALRCGALQAVFLPHGRPNGRDVEMVPDILFTDLTVVGLAGVGIIKLIHISLLTCLYGRWGISEGASG